MQAHGLATFPDAEANNILIDTGAGYWLSSYFPVVTKEFCFPQTCIAKKIIGRD